MMYAALSTARGQRSLHFVASVERGPVQTVPSSVKAWQEISSELAKNASGEVRAVLGSKTRPQNIWEAYELPELIRNLSVTRIIAIDPKTGIERVI